jgi:hypothetical protein
MMQKTPLVWFESEEKDADAAEVVPVPASREYLAAIR